MHCFRHIHEGYGHDMINWSQQSGGPHSHADVSTEAGIITVTPLNSDEPSKEYTVLRGESTLMVNAALQTGPSEWRNAPFLVELPLPHLRGMKVEL